MAPHSSTLAWKIPWTQEPGGVPKSRTRLSDFTFIITIIIIRDKLKVMVKQWSQHSKKSLIRMLL